MINGLTTSRSLLQPYSSPQTGLWTPIPSTEITARFEANGDLSGSAGCNSYNGGFTAYDQTLRNSALSATQSLCGDPEGIMEQEAMFLSLMKQAAQFTISAGQLSVFDNGGNRVLVFVAG